MEEGVINLFIYLKPLMGFLQLFMPGENYMPTNVTGLVVPLGSDGAKLCRYF
jgi:hypothetical protein